MAFRVLLFLLCPLMISAGVHPSAVDAEYVRRGLELISPDAPVEGRSLLGKDAVNSSSTGKTDLAASDVCLNDVSVDITRDCTGQRIRSAVVKKYPQCKHVVPTSVIADFDALCAQAKIATDVASAKHLEHLLGMESEWLAMFFDGGTHWNEYTEYNDGSYDLKDQAKIVEDAYAFAWEEGQVLWPGQFQFQGVVGGASSASSASVSTSSSATDNTECLDSKCTSWGNDCCAPTSINEPATCSDGWVPVRRDEGCAGFADGVYSCCPSSYPEPVCDSTKCTSWGNDCCAPTSINEPATCSDGLVAVRRDEGCAGFDDGMYDCCPPSSIAPPTCEINAMMCCWTRDRQAGDNNGNCRTPYETNCANADPADNTDLCSHDPERSPLSGHVAGGDFDFPGDSEGDIHCHGTAWPADDVSSFETRFAGNNLLYISFYDHLYQRGYVEEIPGAPMCGCLEQMPTVSRADCTEIRAVEDWQVTFRLDKIYRIRRTNLKINYNACRGVAANNDLEQYLLKSHIGGANTNYDEHLVGTCPNA